ncbi:hypothetical protein F3Y22_tig00110109pilonHSYRG00088 [Hibiscus syriacus]|uniref:Pentatricopeptide repeat-containing protein n=1 Tax=Hibiscus syriacus TaxID=106335 RepID=A0A6A3BJL4_HIBSY|nr:hypothetical protein F3Y22_tig00110109pilonHSYRG00088 [Hibiscus syriacus]
MLGKREGFCAANLLNGLHKKGFSLDVLCFTSLITAYAGSGRDGLGGSDGLENTDGEKGIKPDFTEMMTIFDEIKGCNGAPDIVTWNTLLAVLGRTKWIQKCRSIQGDEEGRCDHLYTFVASYASDSMFEEAIDVVRFMIKHGCKPNQNTYNSIVDGYCKLIVGMRLDVYQQPSEARSAYFQGRGN